MYVCIYIYIYASAMSRGHLSRGSGVVAHIVRELVIEFDQEPPIAMLHALCYY